MNDDYARGRFHAIGRLLSRGAEFLPEILLVVATTAAGLVAGGRWVTPEADTGTWWSLSHRLAQGERLYRDVYPDQYGPLSPYLLALAEKVFGTSATEFLVVNWIAGVAAGLLLLRLTHTVLSAVERCGLAGLIIGISVLAPGPGRLVFSYSPGAVHALLFSTGAFLFVAHADGRPRRAALAAGLLAGLAFASKQEIGAEAAVALWTAALVLPVMRGRWLLDTAVGFAAGAAPAALFVLSSAPWDSLRRDSSVWPLVLRPRGNWSRSYLWTSGLSAADWRFVLESSLWTLLAVLVLMVGGILLASRERDAGPWRRVVVSSFLLVVWWFVEPRLLGSVRSPIALTSLVAGFVFLALLFVPLKRQAALVSVSAFAFLTSLRKFASIDVGSHYAGIAHFAGAVTWVLLVCVLAPLALCGKVGPRARARGALAALFLVVGGYSAYAGAKALAAPREEAATLHGSVFLPHADFFRSLSSRLGPGEKVLSLPEPFALEPLFEVRPASRRLLYLPPALSSVGEAQLIGELERNPPDVVVVFTRPTSEYGVAPFGEGYGFAMAEWLRSRYEAVFRHPGGRILRRSRTSTGGIYNSVP